MIAASMFTVMTTPAVAQEAARPVAGCIVAALNYKGHAPPGTEIPKAVEENLTFWRTEFEKVQPDRVKREQLLAGAQEALDKDLATTRESIQKMMFVSRIIALCEVERGKREAQQ